MALSIADVFNAAVDLEKSKIAARMGSTAGQQQAGLDSVPVNQNPQANQAGIVATVKNNALVIAGGAAALMAAAWFLWPRRKR